MSDDDCWDVLLFDDFFACVWIWRMLIWLDDWSWNQQNAGYVCFPAQWGYDDYFQVRWKRWFNKFYGLYGDPHSTNAIAPEEQLAYKKRNCILDVVLYLSLTAHTHKSIRIEFLSLSTRALAKIGSTLSLSNLYWSYLSSLGRQQHR